MKTKIKSFNCCECGKPLSDLTYARPNLDGDACVGCALDDSQDMMIARRRILLDSFLNMLLPIILTVLTIVLFDLLGMITSTSVPQTIDGFLFIASVCYAMKCGAHFTDRFKAYVGDPEKTNIIVDINESWTGKYWASTRSEESYSMGQWAKMFYNILMTIIGTVLVYLFGWLSFIITCIRQRKKKIRALQERFLETNKKYADNFDFHVDEAIQNLDDNKFVVLPVHIFDDLKYLPYHYREDGNVIYIYGVLKLKTGVPAPLSIIYYKKYKLAFPSLASKVMLTGEDLDQETIIASLNSVPSQMDYLKTYFGKAQQKLLGVPGFGDLDEIEFDAHGNVIDYPGKDKKSEKSKTKEQPKAVKPVEDDDDGDDGDDGDDDYANDDDDDDDENDEDYDGDEEDDDDDDDDFMYKVILNGVGKKRSKLIHTIAAQLDIDIDEAETIVDKAPGVIIADALDEDQARELADALKAVGGGVRVSIKIS